jgi:hypothetical protein
MSNSIIYVNIMYISAILILVFIHLSMQYSYVGDDNQIYLNFEFSFCSRFSEWSGDGSLTKQMPRFCLCLQILPINRPVIRPFNYMFFTPLYGVRNTGCPQISKNFTNLKKKKNFF